LRAVSFAIAYRMLGSVSEAEDVVQEGLLRVDQALDAGDRIASPRAFMTTVTTRLAINELRSARVRRERYVGEWLPEPIITDGRDDPARQAEMADSLSLAMLVLLEKLSPEQRAELARRFFAAAEQGDLAGLESLLASDVELTADGGGEAPALPRALRGRSRAARTLIDYAVRRSAVIPGMQIRSTEINGGRGALYLDAQQRLIAAVALDLACGEITGIRSIVNPDKLAHLGPTADLASLVQTRTSALVPPSPMEDEKIRE
jgi:RNA polymerase sigma factor (sigma-70 family)